MSHVMSSVGVEDPLASILHGFGDSDNPLIRSAFELVPAQQSKAATVNLPAAEPERKITDYGFVSAEEYRELPDVDRQAWGGPNPTPHLNLAGVQYEAA